MRFNTRSYSVLPPRPQDKRVFVKVTLSRHATTGVSTYVIDPTAMDGVFHLLYDGTAGVTLFDKPQLLEVNFARSNGSPALTGQYLLGMLPHPGILPMQEHFVASGRQVLPLTGVADLEPGDLVGVAHAPLLRVSLDALQHDIHAAEPHPGQLADCQASAVTSSLDTGEAASAATSPSPALLERLNPDQRSSFLRVRARLRPHFGRLRLTYMTLNGPPRPSSNWVVCSANFPMFSTSTTDFGS